MEHLFYAQLHDEFYKFIFMPCFISLLSKKLLQSIFLYYSVSMHKYTHIHTHTHASFGCNNARNFYQNGKIERQTYNFIYYDSTCGKLIGALLY